MTPSTKREQCASNVTNVALGWNASTFSASGDFEGTYTLSTKVPSGSAVSSCLVAIDGGNPAASVQVDDTNGKTHTVVVSIVLAPAYAGSASCNVSATNDASSGDGETVIISVSGH